MKEKRKLIGVILSDLEEDYQSNVVSGIMAEARRLNYNVAVFSSFIKSKTSMPELELGESDIFRLINTDKFDALIVLPYTLEMRIAYDILLRKVNECHCPVISIDSPFGDVCYTVTSDEAGSIKELTDHIIKHHNKTSIDFLAGTKGHISSERRLEGYKAALEENGIPFDKSRVSYGNYWTFYAVEYAKKLVDSGDIPEAIVCANDCMAIAVCDYLMKNGIRVPEDVIITGYDAIDEGKIHAPQLATVNTNSDILGMNAVQVADKLIHGLSCDADTLVKGTIIPSQTCGCHIVKSNATLAEAKTYENMYSTTTFFKGSNDMVEELFRSVDIKEIRERLCSHVYLIEGLQHFNIFLCQDWDSLYDANANVNSERGYHEVMNAFFEMQNQKFNEANYQIKSSDMLPILFEESEEPQIYFFSPLNFRDQCFGYAAASYGNNNYVIDIRYRCWIKNICNTLEHIRSQKHLQWAMARLDKSSILDSLTGVYNRRGYERYVYAYLDSCKENKQQLLIILADLDCLKSINDLYGHGEGDSAIRIIAKAFQSCFVNDEICARIGGDEFIVVGKGSYTSEDIEEYKRNIESYLNRYNKSSGKPYEVHTSLGILCSVPSEHDTIEALFNKADALMYENKKKHKALRNK